MVFIIPFMLPYFHKFLRIQGIRPFMQENHLGAIGTPGEFPENIGFDVNIAGHAAGGLASYFGKDNFGNKENIVQFGLFLDWRNIMVRIFTLLKQSPKRHCLFWTR